MPAVSIIVPVYKVEQYLVQCIQSLVNQTSKDIEIILVNDGSPDLCGEICDRYAREYPNLVKVIHQENQGVSAARNTGLAAAAGKWITFVDGDDWIAPDMIEDMLKQAEADDDECDVYVYGYIEDYPENSIIKGFDKLAGYSLTAEDKMELYKWSLCTKGVGEFQESVSIGLVWAKLYSKNFLDTHNIVFKRGIILSEDKVFTLYVCQLASKIVFCKGEHYHYRMSATSASNRFQPGAVESANVFLREAETFFKRYHKEADALCMFSIVVIHMLLFCIRVLYRSDGSPYTLPQRIKGISQLIANEPYKAAIRNVDVRYLTRNERFLHRLLKHRLVALYCLAAKMYDGLMEKVKRKFG